jgi:tetratricopeptide (TPR) repeat protein
MALTDYGSGQAKEKAKDYPGAIADLQAALREDPSVTGAYKQLGNCYYYIGDYRRALKCYDRYLLSHPDDDATFAFAQNLKRQLRKEGRRGGREDGDPADVADTGPRRGTFYAGLSGSLFFPGSNDLRNLLGNSGLSLGTNSAFAEEEHFGYLWANGLGLEGGFQYVDREADFTQTSDGESFPADFSMIEFGVFLEPLYRLSLGAHGALIGGLQIGASEAILTDDDDAAAGDFYGGGLVLTPDLRYEYVFGGRFGADLGVQYRIADFDTLHSTAFGGNLENANGSNWQLNDSGLAFRLGLNFYFRRLGQ